VTSTLSQFSSRRTCKALCQTISCIQQRMIPTGVSSPQPVSCLLSTTFVAMSSWRSTPTLVIQISYMMMLRICPSCRPWTKQEANASFGWSTPRTFLTIAKRRSAALSATTLRRRPLFAYHAPPDRAFVYTVPHNTSTVHHL
jgi:hypothetical protein